MNLEVEKFTEDYLKTFIHKTFYGLEVVDILRGKTRVFFKIRVGTFTYLFGKRKLKKLCIILDDYAVSLGRQEAQILLVNRKDTPFRY